MRWGRLCRYATALGISRILTPSPSLWRPSSSRRARFGLVTAVPCPIPLAAPRELGVLDVETRGLEPPAGDLGDQIGGVAQPPECDLRHVLEELRRGQRVPGDESVQALAIE